jgi:polyphosphate glucokinase
MKRVLVIDVGGTTVKLHILGRGTESFPSGKNMTAAQMCQNTLGVLSKDEFDVVTIGYPGVVDDKGLFAEPELLGLGWVGYNFATRFEKDVKIINDAAMQAVGNYKGGRMLFLGLGTGLGTCLIINQAVIPMEIANLPYKGKRSYGDFLAQRGLDKQGEEKWVRAVEDVVGLFKSAFIVEDIVLGGGNAKRLKRFPLGTRKGDNSAAHNGGIVLWDQDCQFSSIPSHTQYC